MIAIHIIQPEHIGKADTIDTMEGYKSSLWFVKADTKHGPMAIGKSFISEDEAVAEWNAMFSKAPIQYTDKGKVCD